MSTHKFRRASYWKKLLTTPRRESQPWEPRTEVVICQTYQEARDHFRRDRDANQDVTLTANGVELTLQTKTGTTRRYYFADQGIERLFGLEIHDYYNLVRHPPERYWEFEEFLRHRVGRTQLFQMGRERRERLEMSTWAVIKEEWRIFLSSRGGRLMLMFTVILVTVVILTILGESQ